MLIGQTSMIRELPPDLAKVAQDELNENLEQTKKDIENLKVWISTQSHLKARTDDQWLAAMLRGCKLNMERVKKKLDMYYALRSTAPDVTLRIKPTEQKFLDFFRKGSCFVLPKPKNMLLPRVIVIRAGAYDPAVNSIADVVCMMYYLVQIMIVDDDVASIMGTIILVDYKGITMNHLIQGTPALLKKMIAVCQDSMPLRLRASHHCNLPPIMGTFFNFISVFLTKKSKDRLKIHKNYKGLLEYLPKEIIPEEYGGTGGTIAEISEYWISKFIEYKTWLRQEEQYGTDESKRVAQPSAKVIKGTRSFRKLDID